jgi:hypothetical protein
LASSLLVKAGDLSYKRIQFYIYEVDLGTEAALASTLLVKAGDLSYTGYSSISRRLPSALRLLCPPPSSSKLEISTVQNTVLYLQD